MGIENENRVPVAQWRKWNQAERKLFNTLYSCMHDNVKLFLHPKQEDPKPVHWKTTAWNAAWIAADELRAQRKEAKE